MRHVLVADDHEITRRGLAEILGEAYPGVEVTEVADGNEVLEVLPSRHWDLILLDVIMPGPHVLELIDAIRKVDRKVAVLVLTAAPETEYIVATLRVGANGLVHKRHAVDELIEAIRQVLDGGTYLHPDSADVVAAALRNPAGSLPHERLSRRELEVFERIAMGRAVKEIASDLEISDKTVATYLRRIREKTGLNSLVDIARYAMHHDLVD